MKSHARWWFALVLLFLAALLFPIYWLVVAALSPDRALFAAPALVPGGLTFTHFRALFAQRGFLTPLRNSLVVAGCTTLLAVTLGALAAYALARLRPRHGRALLGLILAISMFPHVAIVSPLYLLLRALGLIDRYPGLILPYLAFALPLTIWLLVGFFRQLPAEIEQAALMDGASRARVLWEIVLPLALPGIAATAVVTFVYCWNEFLFALSFTLGPERHTVPVAIALFRAQHQVPWGQVFAAALVATTPVAMLVFLLQKRIVEGLTAGAIKG